MSEEIFFDIDELRKQHDIYVGHYNNSTEKLVAISGLRAVQESVTDAVTDKAGFFHKFVQMKINGLRAKEMSWLDESKKEEIRKHKVHPLIYNPNEFSIVLDCLRNVADFYDLYNSSSKGPEYHKYQLKRISYDMLKSYAVKSVIGIAIGKDLPASLFMYDELEARAKSKMLDFGRRKLPGRPYLEEVPQDKIRDVVRVILENQIEGRIVENGKRYSVIHVIGKKEGKGNVNQIYKYIAELHPELNGLSERAMKDRIKEALPDEMK